MTCDRKLVGDGFNEIEIMDNAICELLWGLEFAI